MIKLIFYNDIGEVRFEHGAWRLTEAEGFSVPASQISAVRYINQPGHFVTGISKNPRTITLSGDINLGKCGEDAFSKACAVLEKEGTLRIETLRFKREIGARCIEFVPGERRGPYRSFVMQFLCDCPYFEDAEETRTVIYNRVGYLTCDTVLPAVLSGRIAKGDIKYKGSAFCEPKIIVTLPEGIGVLKIINHTNGGKISVNYDSSQAKSLIINVKNRTITDENDANLLDLLTDDSFFDGFRIDNGENTIEVLNSDASADIKVVMEYKTRHAEAVI